MNKSIIIMKVGPHSGMELSDIVQSKKEEERLHGVHFWGYSGVFCQPIATQKFCKWSLSEYGVSPTLVLLETKSPYATQDIGYINEYSIDNKIYKKFDKPVQLQGAQFSFVSRNIREIEDFSLDNFVVFGGKNDGLPLSSHLRFRVNKSFAIQGDVPADHCTKTRALIADMVEPFAIWLKD